MKLDKRNILITIIVVALIVLIILLFVLIPRISNKQKDSEENNYIYSDKIVERNGTSEISNDALSSEHCLDGICIYDAKIYYLDKQGRVDFKIKNISEETKSGYLKLVFGNDYLITSYKSLAPGDRVEKTTQYANLDLSQATDFKVKKLTKEEKSSIIKSK